MVFAKSSYDIYSLENISFTSFEFMVFITSISLLGSFFMCYAMYLRHKEIQTTTLQRESLFRSDIVYGISITMFVPILYYFGGVIGTSFAFFCASVFAFMIYSRRDLGKI